jgi:hypothetical protein
MSRRKKSATRVGLRDVPSEDDLPQLTEIALTAEAFLENRIGGALREAGFSVDRMERVQCHETVWIVRLGLDPAQEPPAKRSIVKRVRKALSVADLKVRSDELSVLSYRHSKVKVVFFLGSLVAPES